MCWHVDYGISYETYISEHQGEPHWSTVFNAMGEKPWKKPCHDREQEIGEEADAQQRQDETTVRERPSHRWRQDERGTRDVDNDVGETTIQVFSHVLQLARHVAHNDDDKEYQHNVDVLQCVNASNSAAKVELLCGRKTKTHFFLIVNGSLVYFESMSKIWRSSA